MQTKLCPIQGEAGGVTPKENLVHSITLSPVARLSKPDRVPSRILRSFPPHSGTRLGLCGVTALFHVVPASAFAGGAGYRYAHSPSFQSSSSCSESRALSSSKTGCREIRVRNSGHRERFQFGGPSHPSHR